MNPLSFGPRRKKRFVILLVVFFFVPIVSLLPFNSLRSLFFLPMLFWINLVGIPLGMLGVPYFDIHEFGAVPERLIGYAIIALIYLLIAFLLSMIGKKDNRIGKKDDRNNKQG